MEIILESLIEDLENALQLHYNSSNNMLNVHLEDVVEDAKNRMDKLRNNMDKLGNNI